MRAHGLVPTRLSWDPDWGRGQATVDQFRADDATVGALIIQVQLEPNYRAGGGEVDVFNGQAYYKVFRGSWYECPIEDIIARMVTWARASTWVPA